MKVFNVRVYGILFNENNEVLTSDEIINGRMITKFPGGGLEFGEGTIDCVVREFEEELNVKIKVIEHFYTTDFFQISAFNDHKQVLSIYYLVKLQENEQFNKGKFTDKLFDFDEIVNEAQAFRWFKINEDLRNQLTFPIDKRVGEMLIKMNNK